MNEGYPPSVIVGLYAVHAEYIGTVPDLGIVDTGTGQCIATQRL